MATDAKKTLRDAARHRVQLIMHGHRHQPYLGAEQVYAELEHADEDWALGRVAIVGAGSAGSTSVRSDDNYFNVLELQSGCLNLRMFRAQSREGTKDDFREFKSWSASLTADKGQLVLGDWEDS